jgi:predicted dehydrogenase
MDRPPKVALHGAGMISVAHAMAAQASGMPIVAVASRSAERARRLADEVGARVVGYGDLPGTGADRADIVIVSTPPQCHAADAIRLLEAGAAVLLEKPMCRTLAEADAVVAAAAAHDQRLLYGENLAYSPVVQTLLALAPGLGPPTHLEVRALQGLPTWGAFTSDEWGGGALFDLGVHPLAVALLCANACGAGTPVSVSARLQGGVGHHSDEWAEVELHYPGGLRARIESSWKAGPDPVWDVQLASATGVLRAELLPALLLEHNGEQVALPAATTPIAAVDSAGYLGQLQAFAAGLSTGTHPVMSAAFGRRVLDVVCAAYRSAGRDAQPEHLPFEGPRDRTPLELWRG